MKFSRADATFTAAILAGIAILSALLYLHSRTRTAGKGEAIGKVFYKREVAMRKFSDRMVWEDVESGSPLYSHDAVMTGNLSDAELVLNTGLRLKLEANTLVELDLEDEGLKLRLSGGGIKTAGAQGAQTTVTTTDGQAINVTEASASIRTSGNQTAVEVKEGNVAVVTKDGQTQTVAKDEVLSAGKKARVTLQVTGLAEDAVILAAGNTGKVGIGCSAGARSVEIAPRADMANVRNQVVSQTNATVALPAGDWYARCRGDNNAVSAIRHFRVVSAGKYRVLRPDSTELSFTEKPVVRFEFTRPRGVTATRIEIADNPQFANAAFVQTVTRSAASCELPQAGRYYYRLSAIGEDGASMAQLEPVVGNFRLSKIAAASALTFVSVATPTFSLSQVEAGKATIAYEGNGTYKYDIVNRSDGKVTHSGETRGGSVSLPVGLAAGRYEVRMQTATEKAVQPFDVRGKIKIEMLAPVDGTTLYIPLNEKSVALPVSWKASDDVSQYQVILSEDAQFRTILRKINVDQKEFRFTGLGVRSYYLKVLALDNGIPRAESETVRVRVEDRLPAVANPFPRDDQKIDITKSAGLNFRWQPVNGASSYIVKIYQKRKGNLVLVDSKTTKSTALSVADVRKLREGEVIWEVSAQQTDKAGRVMQKSEPVRNSVNLSFGPTPPAPEIVPIVEE